MPWRNGWSVAERTYAAAGLNDAYADGLAFDFVCGDEVYGSSSASTWSASIPSRNSLTARLDLST
jgi:hypothetical protein